MQKFIVAVLILAGFSVEAQILVEDPSRGLSAPVAQAETPVGQEAATDYFKKREVRSEVREESIGGNSRVMMLGVGTFLNDNAYRWGRQKKVNDPGQATLGVSYRVGEWRNSMDLYVRAELMSYRIDDTTPVKISIMPIIAFPDARSEFPLYFGAGMGAGVFFKQVGDESDLSFDYALIMGARFLDVFAGGTGIFVETGLKGMVNLLSSGQQDGVFITVGSIFTF